MDNKRRNQAREVGRQLQAIGDDLAFQQERRRQLRLLLLLILAALTARILYVLLHMSGVR